MRLPTMSPTMIHSKLTISQLRSVPTTASRVRKRMRIVIADG